MKLTLMKGFQMIKSNNLKINMPKYKMNMNKKLMIIKSQLKLNKNKLIN